MTNANKILNCLLAGERINKFMTKQRFGEVELHAVIPKFRNEQLIPIQGRMTSVFEDGESKACSEYWIEPIEIEAYFNDRENQRERQSELVRQGRIDWHVKRFTGAIDWLTGNAPEVKKTTIFRKAIYQLNNYKD